LVWYDDRSLQVGDDLSAAQDRLDKLTLILQFAGKMKEQDLLLKLNGRELSQREVVAHENDRLKIAVYPELSMLKLGENVIESSLKQATPDANDSVQLNRVRV
jgi:hypothetical protein